MKATRNAAALGGKYLGLFGILLLVGAPLAGAHHDGNTCPDVIDPYLWIDTIVDLDGDGQSEIFYHEERDTGLPPVPGSGFLLANGSWTYKESGDLPGFQRGPSPGLLGEWFPPGCDQDPFGAGKIVEQGDGPGLIEDPAGWVGRWSVDPSGTAPGVPCLLIAEDPIAGDCSHGDILVI